MSDASFDASTIDVPLVRRLVAGQFPQWADLPVRPVPAGGWDNRTFHLGERMSVRLPSGPGYAPQVDKEHRWLPVLAPKLPLPVPVPVARGVPAEGYPFDWSVYRWLDGDTASLDRVDDLDRLATDLAGFLVALRGVDATAGPAAGAHSQHRGMPLGTYDEDTRRALHDLDGRVPVGPARAVWETALATRWSGPAVWFHGDVASGNLLVDRGRLAAVIDFGCCGVGDPACDLVIAWTMLTGSSRATFRERVAVDDATWARGRGWALWKALITLAWDTHPGRVAAAGHTLDQVLSEYADNPPPVR